MHTLWIGLALSLGTGVAPAAGEAAAVHAESVDSILAGTDRNLTFTSRSSTMKMTVKDGKRSREYVLRTVARGATEVAIEFVAPARDKGTKVLRRGNKLWSFSPAGERTQPLAGSSLRQGVMDSDFSYDDLTGFRPLSGSYGATIVREETRKGQPCWVLELVAKTKDEPYSRRILWVDKATHIPVVQELYASSGILLKTVEMSGIKQVGSRYVPMRIVAKSHVKKGTQTALEVSAIAFDEPVPEAAFESAWLER